MIDLVCLVLSLALFTCGAIARPRRADCGADFYANGIHPDGIYQCRRKPGGDPAFDGAGGAPDRTVDRPGWFVGQIWCTGGAHPVMWSDGRHYGCQR